MSLTSYKINQIKQNPGNFNNTVLKTYLKYKKVKGYSNLKRDQLITLIKVVSTKKNKNIKTTKKEYIDEVVKLEKSVKEFDKQKKIFEQTRKRINERKVKVEKTNELEKYKTQINNIRQIPQEDFSVEPDNWTLIIRPKYNKWDDILLLLTKIINRGNTLFIGDLDEMETVSVKWNITYSNKYYYIDLIKEIERGIFNVHGGGSGSDQWIEETMIRRDEIFVNLVSIKPKIAKKTRKLVNGQFFSYFHNLPIDLSRYQIYRKDQIESISYEPCLLHALRMSGIEERLLNKAKRYVKIEKIPLKTIKKLAKKINIAISIYDSEGNNYYHYNKEAEVKIIINLQDEHYFIDDNETNITKYALDNLDELKDVERFNSIIGINNKGSYKRSDDRYLNSNKLVKIMLDNKDKYLTEILDELVIKNRHKEILEEDLEFDEDDYEINEYKEKKDTSDKIIVGFDFETTTDEEIHKPYLVCATKYKMIDNKYVTICKKAFIGAECGLQFLQWINEDSILIAHNLKYDYQFIMKHLFCIDLTERNNKIMGGKVRFYNNNTKKTHKLILRDSYLMISKKLKDFPDMFFNDLEKKEIKKEMMPYTLYNKENVEKDTVLINDALEILMNDKKLIDETIKEYNDKKKEEEEDITEEIAKKKIQDIFINNLEKWDLIDGEYFDHINYAVIYCEQDVKVMMKGYFKFREWINVIANVDIVRYLTISSIADDYLVKEECYEGCYKFSGNIRRFIQKGVVGGRCMMRNNIKSKCDERVQDFDAVSLYPSAMARMGFLKGIPKMIINEKYDEIKNYDGYFIKINITKVGKNLHFPIINRVNKKGIREFDNTLLGEIYVDKTTLEDLIKYQNIEFEVIKGYYFNEGRNYKINECIRKLFNERKEQKKKGNLIQEVYKLLMNSCYGKTILKEQEKKVIYKDTEKEAINYIIRNCDNVCEFNKIRDSNKYRIKVLETTDDLFTSPHIGSEILSMSKRIMNEVMCLAEEIGCTINYQDTDSMHILEKDIEKLNEEYLKRFGRQLIGSELGQFHNDFEVGQDKGTIPVSIKSIYCAKKIYMDKISCVKKGKETFEYHLRCKGVPKKSLDKVCKEQYDDDYVALFTDIYNSKSITFDLLASGVKFQFNKDFTVCNIVDFKRTLKI